MDDPNRGRGGRYIEDEHGNRVPVDDAGIPVGTVKKIDPVTVPRLSLEDGNEMQTDGSKQ
jgi:hypothetical protein